MIIVGNTEDGTAITSSVLAHHFTQQIVDHVRNNFYQFKITEFVNRENLLIYIKDILYPHAPLRTLART